LLSQAHQLITLVVAWAVLTADLLAVLMERRTQAERLVEQQVQRIRATVAVAVMTAIRLTVTQVVLALSYLVFQQRQAQLLSVRV